MEVRQREHEQPQRGRMKGRPGWLGWCMTCQTAIYVLDVRWCTVRWLGLKFAFSDCQHRATEPSVHMLTRSTKTHDSRAQDFEADPTQPAHVQVCRVRHGPGSCQAQSDSLEGDQGGRGKAFGNGEHEWCELMTGQSPLQLSSVQVDLFTRRVQQTVPV